MPFRPRLITALAFIILLGCGYFFFGVFIPGEHPGLVARNLAGGYGYSNDFYPIWIGSHELFDGRDPYSPDLIPKIETGLYGRALNRRSPSDDQVNYRAFSYPLYTIFFFAPLSPLPFPSVQIVLSILLPCIAAVTAILWLRILGASLSVSWVIATICLTLASYPVLEGVYAGQPGLVSAALIAGTMAALAKDRLTLAGILLPCASVKPHLVVLIALWLVAWAFSDWARRRSFLIAFALTTLILLACSTWVLPNWFASWMHTLHEYRRISPPPLAQFVLGRVAGNLVSLFLLILAGYLCWRQRRQPASSEGFLMATVFVLATTVVIIPSTIAIYDQFLLLPGVFFLCTHYDKILRATVPVRVLGLVALGSLAWQWVAACAEAIAHWLSPNLIHSSRALLLPLRTAASVPFAFTALLCFVVLQEIRSHKDSTDHLPIS
jgi:glycosyl transferase family 87